jgi:hypothetical protein
LEINNLFISFGIAKRPLKNFSKVFLFIIYIYYLIKEVLFFNKKLLALKKYFTG